jgi:hypothetical protein
MENEAVGEAPIGGQLDGGDDDSQEEVALSAKRRPDSYEWLANRALGRARKLIASADGQPDPMVDFLIASANVLATLELADAIRSAKNSE